jgi:hypothetical protein
MLNTSLVCTRIYHLLIFHFTPKCQSYRTVKIRSQWKIVASAVSIRVGCTRNLQDNEWTISDHFSLGQNHMIQSFKTFLVSFQKANLITEKNNNSFSVCNFDRFIIWNIESLENLNYLEYTILILWHAIIGQGGKDP